LVGASTNLHKDEGGGGILNTNYSNYSNDRSNGNDNRNEKKRSKRKIKKEPTISPIKRFMYIVFWLTILVMSGGLIISQATQYNELRRELIMVQADIEYEMLTFEDLQLRLTLFDSDAYIVMLAQERLGMIFPGQIVFRNHAY